MERYAESVLQTSTSFADVDAIDEGFIIGVMKSGEIWIYKLNENGVKSLDNNTYYDSMELGCLIYCRKENLIMRMKDVNFP